MILSLKNCLLAILVTLTYSSTSQTIYSIKENEITHIKEITNRYLLLTPNEKAPSKIEKKFIEKTWIPIINCFTNGCGNEEVRTSTIKKAYNYILPIKGKERKDLGEKMATQVKKRVEEIEKMALTRWEITKELSYFYYHLANDNIQLANGKLNTASSIFFQMEGEKRLTVINDLKEYYGIDEEFFIELKFMLVSQKKTSCSQSDLNSLQKEFKRYLDKEYYKQNIYKPNIIRIIEKIGNCSCFIEKKCSLSEDVIFLIDFFKIKNFIEKNDCSKATELFSESENRLDGMSSAYREDILVGMNKFNLDDFYNLCIILGKKCEFKKCNEVIRNQEDVQKNVDLLNNEINDNTDSCNFYSEIKRIGNYGQDLSFYVKINDCITLESRSFIMPTGSFITHASNSYHNAINDFLKKVKQKSTSNNYEIFIKGLADAQGENSGYGLGDINIPYSSTSFSLEPINNYHYYKMDTMDRASKSISILSLNLNDKIRSNYELAAIRAYQLEASVLKVFEDKSKITTYSKVGKYKNGGKKNPESRGVEILIIYPNALLDKLKISDENSKYHEIYRYYILNEK